MKKILLLSFILISNFHLSATAAGGEEIKLIQQKWPFSGFTGRVDQRSAQRGLQVYREVCAACHSIDKISFRNLSEIGFSQAEIKAIAAEYLVQDGPNDDGDYFDRDGIPSDYFPDVYPNENAARAANGGAYPPDLSLIIKARPDGANYLYSLLVGYLKTPPHMKMSEGMYYNKYFPGYQIAMPNPLTKDQVEYQDGTIATVEQMSRDLVNFLQWTAEPEMESRKQMGIKTLIFLAIATIFFYAAKKRIWSDVK